MAAAYASALTSAWAADITAAAALAVVVIMSIRRGHPAVDTRWTAASAVAATIL
ncbi:MAG: hypothetical protein OES79_03760 [Planctomycetota bacterium]|nr:hypothetical protein [Planctomycetota bacterium]